MIIRYNINVMQQTACMVVNPITVKSLGYGIWLYQFLIIAYLFTLQTPLNCTPVGRASDLMMALALSFQISCLGSDDLSLVGPTEFNYWTSVAPAFQSWFAVEYSSCFISVINLVLYVRCFDSLMSRGPSRGPNFYVYMNHNRIWNEVVAT